MTMSLKDQVDALTSTVEAFLIRLELLEDAFAFHDRGRIEREAEIAALRQELERTVWEQRRAARR